MPRKKTAARPVVLTIRLSTQEHRIFREIAKRRGLTLASMIRTIVLEAQ